MPSWFNGEWCAGKGGGVVSRGRASGVGTAIASPAGSAQWWNGKVLYRRDAGGRSFLEADGIEVDPQGANTLYAGGPCWAAWLGGVGYRDSHGTVDATWNVAGVGPDGTIARIPYATGSGLQLVGPDGHVSATVAAAPDRQQVQVLGPTQACWTEQGNQIIRTLGIARIPELAFLTHVGFWLQAISRAGVWWLLYQDEYGRLILHPAGASSGYLIVTGNAFDPHLEGDQVVYATAAGERPEDVVVVDLTSLPIVDLRPVSAPPSPDLPPPPGDLPPPPPPPSGGSMSTGLATAPPGFDERAIEWHNCPTDIIDRPLTTQIVRADLSNADRGFNVDFSMESVWKNATPEGWDGGIAFTLGMLQENDGHWDGALPIEFWSGLEAGGGEMDQVGEKWFDGGRRRNMWGGMRQPRAGELTALFVVAGDARGKDVWVVRERSNFFWFYWPAGPASFIAKPVPSGPPVVVEYPAPPVPVDTPAAPPATPPFDETLGAHLLAAQLAGNATLVSIDGHLEGMALNLNETTDLVKANLPAFLEGLAGGGGLPGGLISVLTGLGKKK